MGGVHTLKICEEEQTVIIGGEFGGRLYQANLSNSGIVADIPTSSGACTYSVEYQTNPFKTMFIAGSSAEIDLCTPNFCYKDRTITFPNNWIYFHLSTVLCIRIKKLLKLYNHVFKLNDLDWIGW